MAFIAGEAEAKANSRCGLAGVGRFASACLAGESSVASSAAKTQGSVKWVGRKGSAEGQRNQSPSRLRPTQPTYRRRLRRKKKIVGAKKSPMKRKGLGFAPLVITGMPRIGATA